MPSDHIPINSKNQAITSIVVLCLAIFLLSFGGFAVLVAFNYVLDVATNDEKSMDDVDLNVLPRQEVAAPEPTPKQTEQQLLDQTLKRVRGILTEDLRLRDDATSAEIALWIENNFRHTDTELLACIEDLFIDGGGKIDEVLAYCSAYHSMTIIDDQRVAQLNAELDENQDETAVVLDEPE